MQTLYVTLRPGFSARERIARFSRGSFRALGWDLADRTSGGASTSAVAAPSGSMEPGPRGQVSPGETRCQSCATQDSGCCTEASSLGVESSGQSGDTNFSGAPRRSSEFGAGVYGCAHYRRRCKIVAPCCGEIFWCRHCHNESKNIDEKARFHLLGC